jgi:hypothetical protein
VFHYRQSPEWMEMQDWRGRVSGDPAARRASRDGVARLGRRRRAPVAHLSPAAL